MAEDRRRRRLLYFWSAVEFGGDVINVLQRATQRGTKANGDARAAATAFAILEVCGDRHSLGSYIRIANTWPEAIIFEALSLTKDQAARGRITKSRGAYFTNTVARLARERGLNENDAAVL